VVFITSSYGLGETVVQGAVNPDEFYVYKPALQAGRRSILRRSLGSKAIKMVFSDKREAGRSVLTLDVPEADRRKFSISDAEVEELARYALIIEKHYGRPMDVEWGRDGVNGKLYILQARPETVKANAQLDTQKRYRLKERSRNHRIGPCDRQSHRHRPGAAGGRRERDVARRGGRRAGHRYDRSRIGSRS
jgi:pyruvate,water dikinase